MIKRKMRPFSSDTEGKEWFIRWLSDHRFSDIVDTDSISRFYHWDVEATLNGVRYCFELKNRTFPSYQFGDAVINKYKYDYLVDCPNKGVLVMFWTDCFVMIDVKRCHPTEEITRECHRQTWFSDKRLYENRMVRWNIQNMTLLSYDE